MSGEWSAGVCEAMDPRQLIVADRMYGGSEEFPAIIQCPVCKFEYTHTQAAYTQMGGDEGHVYSGTEVRGDSGYRRSALVVEFLCESGHRFALVIQQHKGINLVGLRELAPDPELEVG